MDCIRFNYEDCTNLKKNRVYRNQTIRKSKIDFILPTGLKSREAPFFFSGITLKISISITSAHFFYDNLGILVWAPRKFLYAPRDWCYRAQHCASKSSVPNEDMWKYKSVCLPFRIFTLGIHPKQSFELWPTKILLKFQMVRHPLESSLILIFSFLPVFISSCYYQHHHYLRDV